MNERAPDGTMDRLNTALTGRYVLERKLGEGGMAGVYLARDLKHDRQVAIKVLRPELAAVIGGDRFLAEIRTTANLQHPHILPLFDSGEADGYLYYVMPLVAGDSLSDRITREGQLPIDEAVAIARAVAGALDYAHRQGVIHRDIKPANILLHDGQPVVSDFGIALAVSAAGAGRMTETGLSLGTPYYMSPEQAAADRDPGPASDVYSLACVLYEMLVGEPPFPGSSAQAILAKILTADLAPARAARPSVPPHVDAALRKALARLPADRFPSAATFAAALGDPTFRLEEEAATVGTARRDVPLRAAVGLIALGVVVGGLAVRALSGPDAPPVPVRRFEIGLPEGFEIHAFYHMAAISPDDERLALVLTGPEGGEERMWVRERGSYDLFPVPGTERAIRPIFSPDGDRVFFGRTGDTHIWSTRLDGSPPVEVFASQGSITGMLGWSGGEAELVYGDGRVLFRRSASGEPDTLATGAWFHSISLLPDGSVLATVFPGPSIEPSFDRSIVRVDPRARTVDTLAHGYAALYAGSGHLVWTLIDGTMVAAPFNVDEGRLSGTPVALPDRVAQNTLGPLSFTISARGTLVYWSAPSDTERRELMVTHRSGRPQAVLPVTGLSSAPNVSPDGRRVARMLRGATGALEIQVTDLRTGQGRLVPTSNVTAPPTWISDDELLVPVSEGQGAGLRRISLVVGGDEMVPADVEGVIFRAILAPDGRNLVVATLGAPDDPSISVVDPTTGEVRARVERAIMPALSRDGRWLAYVHWPGGSTSSWRVQIRPFPDVDREMWPVTSSFSRDPVWSRAGDRLYFTASETDGIQEVAFHTEPDVGVGPATSLFRHRGALWEPFQTTFDVAPGDSTFVWFRGPIGERPLRVVEGFFRELEERAGPGGAR